MNENPGWTWTEPYHGVTHYKHADANHRVWGTLSIYPRFVEGYCYDAKTCATYAQRRFLVADYPDAEAALHAAKMHIQHWVS